MQQQQQQQQQSRATQCQRSSSIGDPFPVDLGVDLCALQPEIIQCKRRFQQDLWNTICNRVLQGQLSWTKNNDGGAAKERDATEDSEASKERATNREAKASKEAEAPSKEEPPPPPPSNNEEKNTSNLNEEVEVEEDVFQAKSWNNKDGDSGPSRASKLSVSSATRGRSRAFDRHSRASVSSLQRQQLQLEQEEEEQLLQNQQQLVRRQQLEQRQLQHHQLQLQHHHQKMLLEQEQEQEQKQQQQQQQQQKQRPVPAQRHVRPQQVQIQQMSQQPRSRPPLPPPHVRPQLQQPQPQPPVRRGISLHTGELPKLAPVICRYLPLAVPPEMRRLQPRVPRQQFYSYEQQELQRYTLQQYSNRSLPTRYAVTAGDDKNKLSQQFVLHIKPQKGVVDMRKCLVAAGPSCIIRPLVSARTKPSPIAPRTPLVGGGGGRSYSATSRRELLVSCQDASYAADADEELVHPSDTCYDDQQQLFYASSGTCSAGAINVNHYNYGTGAISDDSDSCVTTTGVYSSQQPQQPQFNSCDSSTASSYASRKFVPLVVGNWWGPRTYRP